MSSIAAVEPRYATAQRLTALAYGAVCHALFAAAILTMAASLFTGLRFGLGPFRGWAAAAANIVLLAAFPLTHSWLLSPPGRRFMARLAPAGIAKELSTTVFAAIASLQLLLTFLLWSPSGVVWWEAHGAVKLLLAAAAAGAWLLLAKSMADAQLGLQTGFLGWSAVFRNRRPAYRPFATAGVYRYVRQPIYISFALVLWLDAAWTPDQLVLAMLWTGYCVGGAALKERRYLSYFGDAYRAYQARVPFWFPRLRRARAAATEQTGAAPDADVFIAGAGPVGLLLANLLGRRGLRVLVAERRTRPPAGSMAIGITPPSLAILRALDLDQPFVAAGLPIDTARVYENGELLGEVDFSRIPADHRFILSLPQSETVRLLRGNLQRFPNVRILDGVALEGCAETADGVRVTLCDADGGARTTCTAAWLAGCDGHQSAVRRAAGIRTRGHAYRPRFIMADFEDDTGLGDDARLYFGRAGSVESFPLPGGLRRWIVMADRAAEDARGGIAPTVARIVRGRTGFDVTGALSPFESAFRPERRLAASYVKGRVVLCGDAAHVMSPIGGQGMNTGFADAAHLADALAAALADPATATAGLAAYERDRRRAFRIAADRAARGMWLGTRTGTLWSALRRVFIARVLLRTPVRERLAPYFAMLTLPGRPGARPHALSSGGAAT